MTNLAHPDTLCSHCGLVVPQGLVRREASEQFCCSACETVFSILSQNGLKHYYSLREKFSQEQIAPPKGSKTFNYFDDEAFQRIHLREGGRGSAIEFYVEGLHCAACVWLLENSPKLLPGLREVRVDFSRALARVECDLTQTKLSRIAALFQSLGYTPHPYRSLDRRDLRRTEERRLLAKMGIAFIGASNAMMLAICLYAGLFSGISTEYSTLFRWFSLLLTTPVILYSASAFYRGAFAALRVRRLSFDLPISLGLLAGYLLSVVNTVRGVGEVYFDTVNILVFFLLVSRWLQLRARKISQEASEFLLSFLPSSARVVREKQVVEIPLEQIANGETLEVLAHEIIPVDGRVESGSGWIDTSLLTGESRPLAIHPGERVHAGTQNLGAPLRIITEASGEETRIGRFLSVVDETISRKAPVLQLVDRIAPKFTVTILLASIVAFLFGALNSFEEGITRAVALLVVCCPCALAMATPLALAVNVGRAARRGVYVKGGDVVERAASLKTIVFDKTGTLTKGQFQLLSWEGENTDELRCAVATLESRSVHPIARALSEIVAVDSEPDEVREELGSGIRGRVHGRSLVIGNESFLERSGQGISAEIRIAGKRVGERGETPVYLAVDGRCVAVLGLGDPVRAEAFDVLKELRSEGFKTELLSGDERTVVNSVGQRLGFAADEIVGSASPEEKFRRVEGRPDTLMIGDGVNDAGALAAATVGMAAHGGAEGSLVVSDVFLTRPDLGLVVEFVRSARETMKVIRRNLGFSLLYNLIGAGLAITGYLSPLAAAILMPISSITVFSSSMMNRSFSHPQRS